MIKKFLNTKKIDCTKKEKISNDIRTTNEGCTSFKKKHKGLWFLCWIFFWPFLIIYYYFKFLVKLTIECCEVLKSDANNKKKIIYVIIWVATFLILILSVSLTKTIDNSFQPDNNVLETKPDVEKTDNEVLDNDGKVEHHENITKTYDISSKEYFNAIDEAIKEIVKNDEIFYYDGFTMHYPYIQVAIKPRKRIDKNDMDKHSKEIGNEILNNLKKYKYKSGGIFKYNYEYINIYFYDYTTNGQLTRNGGPFFQIEILNIKKLILEDIIK